MKGQVSLNNRKDLVSQLPQIKAALQSGKMVEFETHGISMLPLLHDGGDKVILTKALSELSLGDVALCKTDDGRYVLHRVIAKEKGNYILKGDNCVTTECCLSDYDVIGVADSFIRRGKVISVSDKKYLFYVRHRSFFIKLWRAFWRVTDFFVRMFRR